MLGDAIFEILFTVDVILYLAERAVTPRRRDFIWRELDWTCSPNALDAHCKIQSRFTRTGPVLLDSLRRELRDSPWSLHSHVNLVSFVVWRPSRSISELVANASEFTALLPPFDHLFSFIFLDKEVILVKVFDWPPLVVFDTDADLGQTCTRRCRQRLVFGKYRYERNDQEQ